MRRRIGDAAERGLRGRELLGRFGGVKRDGAAGDGRFRVGMVQLFRPVWASS